MTEDRILSDGDNIPLISISDTEILDHANDGLADLAEVGIDLLIKEGIFREIPIIKTLVGIVNIYIKSRDWLLLRNVERFRYHLKDISEENKRAFIEKLRKDEDYKQRVGENLILLLNRVDDIRKPELFANLLCALIERKIDDEKYQKLEKAIDRLSIHYIPHLMAFYSGFDGRDFELLQQHAREMPDDALQDLVFCGLIDIRINPNILIDTLDSSSVSDIGMEFIEFVLKNTKFKLMPSDR